MIIFLLAWVLVLIVHELGHYLGFLLFGINSKLRFTWIGPEIYASEGDKIKVWQSFIVMLMGPVLGLIPLLILIGSNIIYFFIYYVICTVDMAQCYIYINNARYYNKKVGDLSSILMEEAEKNG